MTEIEGAELAVIEAEETQVERPHPLLDRAVEYKRKIDADVFEYASILKQIRDNCLFKNGGYQTLEEFLENCLAESRRTAFNYLKVADALEEFTPMQQEKIKALGMTKAGLVVRYLTKENFSKRYPKIADKSASQIKEIKKLENERAEEALRAEDEAAKERVKSQKPPKLKRTVNLDMEGNQLVEDALQAVKDELQVEDDGVAMAAIASEYLSGSVAQSDPDSYYRSIESRKNIHLIAIDKSSRQVVFGEEGLNVLAAIMEAEGGDEEYEDEEYEE